MREYLPEEQYSFGIVQRLVPGSTEAALEAHGGLPKASNVGISRNLSLICIIPQTRNNRFLSPFSGLLLFSLIFCY